MALSRILANDFARLLKPSDDPDSGDASPFAPLHRTTDFALPAGSTLTPFAQYPATIALGGLDGTTGFKINGLVAGERVGWDVSGLGDVNNDGVADYVLGGLVAHGDAPGSGAAYVLSGAHSFSASTNVDALGAFGFKINGVSTDDFLGQVSAAGDVNGDGFADILVGAIQADPHGTSSGAAYVVFGSANAFAANVDLAGLSGTNGFKISGTATNDVLSSSLSSADINGDGYSDLIIGAREADPHGSASGATYVVFGKANGFASNIEASALDGANGFKISGMNAYERTGASVGSAGDVNGDGIADIVIGTSPSTNFDTNTAYVVFGHTGSFASNFDLSALNGANGFRLHGVVVAGTSNDNIGASIAAAGDVNGDGIGDIIVSATAADSHNGAAYVVFGTSAGFAPDVSVTSLTGSNGFKIAGIGGELLGTDVASAGDVNGDGFADVIVGATNANGVGGYGATGAAYVVFGGPSMAASISVASLNGSNGFALLGAGSSDVAGHAVSSAGDINGDGFADLIVGAPLADPQSIDEGTAYIVYGRMPDAAVTRTGTAASQTLAGGNFNDTLSGLGGNDDLFGHGGNDTLSGGTGADTFHFSDLGPANVDTIADYSVSDGDKIDLTALLPGSAAVSPSDYVRFVVSGSDLVVQADTDGTGSGATWADVAILTGDAAVTPLIKIGNTTINQTTSGNDTVIGAADHANLFDLSAGGNDTVTGGNLNDGFSFGAAYTPADHVDGGAGTNDQIAVQGDYSAGVTLSGASIVNVEVLAMLPGFNYHFTTADDLVGAGNSFAFWSVSMTSANHVFIDGSAETNGSFRFLLGAGNDTAVGGSGADTLFGGDGADDLTGGGGADTFRYIAVSNSTGASFDVIHDFAAGVDRFDLPGAAVTGVDLTVASGALATASFDGDLAAAVDAGHLAAQHAVLFTPSSGDYPGHTFLVVDANGTAGYQAGVDFVFDVTGLTGTLTTASFI